MKTILFALIAVMTSAIAFADDVVVPAPAELVKNIEVTNPDATKSLILANSFSQTLYTFDMDSADASACNGKCAEVWPPITLTPDEVAALAGNPDLGVIARTSGLSQLTFKGQPVYLFHLDRVVGDIKGDGVGGVWHIIK